MAYRPELEDHPAGLRRNLLLRPVRRRHLYRGLHRVPQFQRGEWLHLGLQLDHRQLPAELQPSAAAHPGIPEQPEHHLESPGCHAPSPDHELDRRHPARTGQRPGAGCLLHRQPLDAPGAEHGLQLCGPEIPVARQSAAANRRIARRRCRQCARAVPGFHELLAEHRGAGPHAVPAVHHGQLRQRPGRQCALQFAPGEGHQALFQRLHGARILDLDEEHGHLRRQPVHALQADHLQRRFSAAYVRGQRQLRSAVRTRSASS